MIPIYFNNVRLDEIEFVEFSIRLPHSMPQRDVDSKNLANEDGSKLVSADFSSRQVVLEGNIIAPDRASAEVSRDNLMSFLTVKEKPLKIDQSGVEREYTATMQNIIFSEAKGGFIPFVLTFLCSDPFGHNTQETPIALGAAITTFYAEKTFNILGNYKSQPVITLTFNSVGGATGKIVTLTNPDDGTQIIVNRDWSNADVLEVDSVNKTVKVNGTEVNYTGRFLEFEPGTAKLLTYEDNFTSRNVSFGFTYTKRWI